MKRNTLTVLSLMLAGLAGLVWSQEKAVPAKTPAAPAPSAVAAEDKASKVETLTVIGYVQKRDRVITIKSGPKGVVYSVATTDGKILFENLTAQQLQARAPELHEFFKGSLAGDAASKSADRRVRADSAVR
jgi:hypothetical protein